MPIYSTTNDHYVHRWGKGSVVDYATIVCGATKAIKKRKAETQWGNQLCDDSWQMLEHKYRFNSGEVR